MNHCRKVRGTLLICGVTERQEYFQNGQVILIDKELEWTSFDVVKRMRGITKVRKVGHAGTLDPLATGLLIVCTGKATKTINSVQAMEKEYSGEIRLGATTASYDLETEVIPSGMELDLTNADVEVAVQKLTGEIEQIPPVYSAVKVDGERAYKKARRGEEIQIKSRTVVVSEFHWERQESDLIRFRIVCSKGTYIRTIANDLGVYLGCGAYLASLRRERIGEYHVKDARLIGDFASHVESLFPS